MMTMRDAVCSMVVKEVEGGKTLYISTSIDRADTPVPQGVIRMTFYDATLVEQVGDDLKLVKFGSFDLGGYFPARLINMLMAKQQDKMGQQLYDKVKAQPV